MPEELTPERIVHDLFPTVLSPRTGEWEVRRPSSGDILDALRTYGDRRAAGERERCAKVAAGLYGCDEHCVKHYRPHGKHAPDCRAEVCEDVADALRNPEE